MSDESTFYSSGHDSVLANEEANFCVSRLQMSGFFLNFNGAIFTAIWVMAESVINGLEINDNIYAACNNIPVFLIGFFAAVMSIIVEFVTQNTLSLKNSGFVLSVLLAVTSNLLLAATVTKLFIA